MSFINHRVAIEAIKHRHAYLKFLYLECLLPVETLYMVQLYGQNSFSRNDLGYNLITVLRNDAKYPRRLSKFMNVLAEMHSTSTMDIRFEEVYEETIKVIDKMHADLLVFDGYKEGKLIFNTLWFEKPDTITFFRMEQSDV